MTAISIMHNTIHISVSELLTTHH